MSLDLSLINLDLNRSTQWQPTPFNCDGATRLTRDGALTGQADSTLVSGMADFTTTATAGTLFTNGGATSTITIQFLSGLFRVLLRDTAGTPATLLDIRSSAVNDGTRKRVHWRYNGAAGTSELYVNGVSNKATTITEIAGTVDLTHTTWGAFGNYGASGYFTGTGRRIALWFGTAHDVTNAGTRALMDQGGYASPIVDLFGPASRMNAGTNSVGGNFALAAGTFT